MQTFKLSLSLPDEAHPDVVLRVSTHDTEYDVVIALPVRVRDIASAEPGSAASREEDEYVLGGYAGI